MFNFETEADNNTHLVLEILGPLTRCSKDNNTNARGLWLIEMCCNSNLFIQNGRVESVRGGDCTFRGRSVIDYALSTS